MEIKRIVFAIMLGGLSIYSQAQQPSNNTAVFKHLNNGNKLLEANDSMAAAKSYIEATKVAPTMAEPYERVGMIYSQIPQRFYQMQAKTNLQKFIELTTDEERRLNAQEQLQRVEDFLAKEDIKDSISGINSTLLIDTIQTTSEPLIDDIKEKTAEIEIDENVMNNVPTKESVENPVKPENYNPFLTGKKKKKENQNTSTTTNRNDELQNAYIWRNEDIDTTKPLYSIQHLVETPLADELTLQTNSENITQTNGRWASTLRNTATKRELFLMQISPTERKLEILPESDIALQGKANGTKWVITDKEITDKNVRCNFKLNFQARSMQEVESFIQEYIALYVGTVAESNHSRIIALNDPAYGPFNICSNIQLNLKAARYSLHGNVVINVLINQDTIQIPVFAQHIPCTMYKAGDDYTGFDQSTVAHPDFEKNDTIMFIDIQNKDVKDASDLNNLAYCYLNGLGVKQNYSKAATYFEEAAQKGNTEALANLFLIYNNGFDGKGKNQKKALEQLAIGRERKSVTALNISADLLLDAPAPNATTAFKWFDMAQQQNDAYAIYRLGQMTKDGIGQVQSYPAARGRFEKSRDMGCSDAYYELALMALNGLGGQKKIYDAYRNAIAGAQTGSLKAMQMVAEMYFTGIGVRKDFNTGLKWISLMKEAEYNTLIGYKHVEK